MGDLRQIKKRAGDLLADLGRDPDEVAAVASGRRGAGRPPLQLSCAIALYTAAVLRTDPRIRSVAVGPCTLVLTLDRPDDSRPGGRLTVQLPKAVRGFVAGFDAHAYPEVLRLTAPDAPAAPEPAPVASP